MSASPEMPESKQGKVRQSIVAKIVSLAVMTALVFVITTVFSVPISAVGQRFDGGDIMIFIAAWTFGPAVGGFSGGVGSALSDALNPGPYAPFTLVIKGFEGYIAGYLVARRPGRGLKVSWLIASIAMVGGYFVTNAYLIAFFFGSNYEFNPLFISAVIEVPFDIGQVLAGGLIGRPVSSYLKKTLPSVFSSASSFRTG